MTADLFVVHLVSRGAAGVRSGWDTPNGTVRHEVVSWSRSPATLSEADIVVAHGLAPLVVAQAIVGAGPRLVYRPVGATRASRRRLRRGLRADWIAAPSRRVGRASASALGLDRSRVTVFRSDDRASWDALTAELLGRGAAAENPAPPSDGALGAERADRGTAEALTPVAPATEMPAAAAEIDSPPVAARKDQGFPPRAGEPPRDDSPRPAPIAAVVVAATTGTGVAPGLANLAVGVVDPTKPGQPWWRYRRMDLPRGAAVPVANDRAANRPVVPSGGASPPGGPPRDGESSPPPSPGAAPGTPQIVSADARSGVGFFALGMATIVIVAALTQVGTIGEGPFLIPAAGVFFALSAARHIARKRPDEAWVGNWLVWGVVAKLLAANFRYYTLIHTYNGLGDASGYDSFGRQYANHWLNGAPGPKLPSPGLRKTNFIRWFTGVTYYSFGSKLLTGTFVFALLALLGSYFWYRATVDSVPIVDKRLYMGFVMFAPSIIFWPSIIGKEALMQFGLGIVALGASFLLRQRLATGLLVAIPGGWLVWVVRPHLLALIAIAAGAAYLAGRVRKQHGKAGLLTRPFGIIIMAFLVAFTVGQGAKFLGISSLSLSSIQSELDATTASTSEGGSQFQHGSNSLSPLSWPMDAVTVFLRPFPWEIEGSLQILASLESLTLAVLLVVRFKSLRTALARSRESPFLMLCWVLTGLYAVSFASFANFGLLVRERSLVLPALLVLVSVDPRRVRVPWVSSSDGQPRPEPMRVV
jgi:hypothetical protein